MKRFVVTFAEPMTVEASQQFAVQWQAAMTDRRRRDLVLGYPARLTEIEAPDPRPVWVKNAQRRLR